MSSSADECDEFADCCTWHCLLSYFLVHHSCIIISSVHQLKYSNLSYIFPVCVCARVLVCYSGDHINVFLITGTPFKLKSDLKFCPYNGTGCCDLDEDLLLENQFRQMNISNARCASLIKSILCAVSFWGPRTIMMSILGHIYGKLGDHHKTWSYSTFLLFHS